MKPSSATSRLAPIHSENVFTGEGDAMASEMNNKLRVAGLRPTRTRVALAYILFAQGNRHVSAEMLFEEANRAKVSVALATVYNTLHEFTKSRGFLRQVAINSSKSYFDTNNTEHHHYYLEDRHELMDIPPTDVAVGKIPRSAGRATKSLASTWLCACGARLSTLRRRVDLRLVRRPPCSAFLRQNHRPVL